MSSHAVYRKRHFIVVKSFFNRGMYYTVINTIKKTHCHVSNINYTAARVICYRASREEIPDHYPEWMKDRIRRIL
jgi:hypothetical protein